ncbi:MAG: fibronectin type III domain-containing protein [Candidatus Eisenbacteria bacterium]
MMKRRPLFALCLGLAVLAAAAGCGDDGHPTEITYYPPPVPSGVYTVTGDESVQVYWSPIRGGAVEKYGVYRSLTPDGEYKLIGEVLQSDDPYYIDSGLTNGVTYYYAVDAWSRYGDSELSYELVADTPRPSGIDVVVYDDLTDPDRAGIDLSRVMERGIGDDMVRPFDDPLTDYFVIVVDSLLRLVGTVIEHGGEDHFNLVQDFGYTYDFDEISFAPDVDPSYSFDPYGVELLIGHTYVLWTWDDHFAKLRVTELGDKRVWFDWAYQTSDDGIERRQLKALSGAVAGGPGGRKTPAERG